MFFWKRKGTFTIVKCSALNRWVDFAYGPIMKGPSPDSVFELLRP